MYGICSENYFSRFAFDVFYLLQIRSCFGKSTAPYVSDLVEFIKIWFGFLLLSHRLIQLNKHHRWHIWIIIGLVILLTSHLNRPSKMTSFIILHVCLSVFLLFVWRSPSVTNNTSSSQYVPVVSFLDRERPGSPLGLSPHSSASHSLLLCAVPQPRSPFPLIMSAISLAIYFTFCLSSRPSWTLWGPCLMVSRGQNQWLPRESLGMARHFLYFFIYNWCTPDSICQVIIKTL